MSASRLPVADDDAFCAKRNNSRSPAKRRQAAAGLSGAGIYTARAMNQRSFSKIFRGRGLIALGLVLILTFNFAIRWRLREMPLERDEGEYAYAGQLLLQGIPPYQLAYNMKFPGAYFGYAMLMEIFGESARGIHLGIALVTSLTAVFVFLIGCRLLNRAGGLIAAASFVLLSLSPAMLGFAGHATHFVALFAVVGVWALLKMQEKQSRLWALIAGAAFGTAMLMKQHAMFFAPLGLLWLAWRARQSQQTRAAALRVVSYAIGCVLPLLLMVIVLACFGVLDRFYFWTLKYAGEYVSLVTLQSAWAAFAKNFLPIFKSAWWFWLAGVAGLAITLVRNQSGKPLRLAALLFIGAMLAACPGFYFRNHYFLAATPGLALLIAVAVVEAGHWLNQRGASAWVRALPVGLFCLCAVATAWGSRGVWFVQSPDEISRRTYKANPFIESVPVAAYLNAHTAPDEKIAVLGSEPQIYFLAKRHSATGYIYTYSLTELQGMSEQMRAQFINEIETARPNYVALVNLESSWLQMTFGDDTILNWWKDYSQNYELVGAADVFDDKPSQYFWDEQLLNRTNAHTGGILVYRRKPPFSLSLKR